MVRKKKPKHDEGTPREEPLKEELGLCEEAIEDAEGAEELSPGVLIVREKPGTGSWLVIPPLVAMMLACGALLYRIGTPDWRWGWPSWVRSVADPKPEPLLAAAEPPSSVEDEPAKETKAEAKTVEEAPQAEAPVAADDGAVEVLADPVDEDAAEPASPGDGPEAPLVAEAKPENQAEADAADVQREADRIKAEREELERIKKEEGEKLAQARRSPRGNGFFFMNPRQLRVPRGAMERRMQEQLDAQLALIEKMMQQQAQMLGDEILREFGLGGGVGGMEAEMERLFEMMRKDLEAFERQARIRPFPDRARRGRGGRNPIVPDPPQPAEPVEKEDEKAKNPQIRRFNFTDANGRWFGGVEIRSTAGARRR
jgi:hypothetical protein